LTRLASRLGVRIITGLSVDEIHYGGSQIIGVTVSGDGRRERLVSDYYLSALPVQVLQSLVAPEMRSDDYFGRIMKISTVGSTSVTIWFDRIISGTARGPVLVETGIIRDFVDLTWIRPSPGVTGSVIQLLISGPETSGGTGQNGVLMDEVLRRFVELWPPARDARVLRAFVQGIPHAMYAAYPGVESYRPSQRTPMKNFFLAGDWTRHNLNACMEGAFVSGMMAANGILEEEGLSPVGILHVDDDPLLKATKKLVHLGRTDAVREGVSE
jgi:phytoene dehydrogenase-like protein